MILNQSKICSNYITEIIQEYDSQGFHRTGTKVSLNSALWLAQRMQKFGIEAILEPFPISLVVPIQAYLQVGQCHITGLPLFDGTFTDAGGIQGKLGMLGTQADIAVIRVRNWCFGDSFSNCFNKFGFMFGDSLIQQIATLI